MRMQPNVRKYATLAHVITSVGWLGAVSCFIALSIAGLKSDETQVVRAACLAMDVIAEFVIVPFCIATFITGLILSFGTEWGIFRYYWILAKLLISVIATIGLLVHLKPIRSLALDAVNSHALFTPDLHTQIQLLVVAGAALVVLIFASALSVFKPKGITPYGWRKQQNEPRKVRK